jgi:hypothetical protein
VLGTSNSPHIPALSGLNTYPRAANGSSSRKLRTVSNARIFCPSDDSPLKKSAQGTFSISSRTTSPLRLHNTTPLTFAPSSVILDATVA